MTSPLVREIESNIEELKKAISLVPTEDIKTREQLKTYQSAIATKDSIIESLISTLKKAKRDDLGRIILASNSLLDSLSSDLKKVKTVSTDEEDEKNKKIMGLEIEIDKVWEMKTHETFINDFKSK